MKVIKLGDLIFWMFLVVLVDLFMAFGTTGAIQKAALIVVDLAVIALSLLILWGLLGKHIKKLAHAWVRK